MKSEAKTEYCLVQPPFERIPEDMTPKERRDYYAWFIGVISERVEQLSHAVRRTSGFESWQPSYAPSSLELLGQWFADQAETRRRSPEEMKELRAKLRTTLPGVEPPEQTLTHRTVSLSFDIGIYLGQVFVTSLDGVRWKQALGGKTSVDFGHPVLIGLPLGQCNPVQIALSLASALSDGSRDSARLRELYDIWTGKKPITLPRFKQK